MITLATIQAILTGFDRYLHTPHEFDSKQTLLNRIIEAQPPLLVPRTLIIPFNLDWLCTTHAIRSNRQLGLHVSLNQLFPLDHKAIFTGSLDCLCTVTSRSQPMGLARTYCLTLESTRLFLLVLAYTGSRFVLEMIFRTLINDEIFNLCP